MNTTVTIDGVLYHLLRKLNCGPFGDVYEAVQDGSTSMDQDCLAIKKCIRNTADFMKECQLISEMSNISPQVVKCHMYGKGDDHHLYLVTEYCNGGDLYEYIINHDINEVEARNIFRQIITCVNTLHSNDIMHRDVKPENFVLDSNSGKNGLWKMIDFGFACRARANDEMDEFKGTPYYVSPEVLRRQYTRSCDIWSCGIVLYVLLYGEPPFAGKTNKDIFTKIKKGSYICPKNTPISDEAKELLTHMLCPESARYDAQQCLKHPWLVHDTSHNAEKYAPEHYDSSLSDSTTSTVDYDNDRSVSNVSSMDEISGMEAKKNVFKMPIMIVLSSIIAYGALFLKKIY